MYVCITILNCALHTGDAHGQFSDTSRFSFIRYDKNALVFPNGDHNYFPFFDKMQRLLVAKEGQVNIMHIGGSHVQAGVWTEGLRNSIKTLLPGVSDSRGTIFPYRVAGTTQPVDYTVNYGGTWVGCRNVQKNKDCPLGLMGISATTRDSNAYLVFNSKSGYGGELCFRKFKIFHQQDPASYQILFPQDSMAVVTEDSVQGVTLVELSCTLDTLYLQLHKTEAVQSFFTLYGIRVEPEQPAICFDAIGNNGADLPAYLRCTLFERQLEVAQPDLVILSVGINDAYTNAFNAGQFKNNYRALISMIHAAAPHCAILFTTNNDSYYRRRYANANGAKVQQAMFELAEEYDGGVWDLYTIMGGWRSINQWVALKLARTDRIHFTSVGYQLIGELLSEALVNSYLEYCRQQQAGD